MTGGRPIIVTGGGGFVGRWLIAKLAEDLPGARLISMSARGGNPADTITMDVRDSGGVEAVIRDLRPFAVVHLAAMTFVPDAEADPRMTYDVNLYGTLNLALSVLRHAPDCRFIFISSAEVYAGTLSANRMPVDETAALQPMNIYASAKAGADLLVGQLAYRNLSSVRFRPFNHIGPGQADHFAIPSFIKQIVAAERGERDPIIRVGNLDTIRDFLDVRDVVSGYAAAVTRADPLPPGTVLNLASGIPRKVSDVLCQIVSMSTIQISIEIDELRFRASDFPYSVGDPTRAKALLNWSPQYDFKRTLSDMFAVARRSATISLVT